MPNVRALLRRGPRVAALALVACATAYPLAAQVAAPREASRVTVSFDQATIQDVAAFFARYSGRSIVLGNGVAGTVSAEISNQPWDVALAALLGANGLAGRELASGIILVEKPAVTVEAPGRLVSRVFRLNYSTESELEAVVRSMLTPLGAVAVVTSINAIVVTDEERVLSQVAAVLGQI